MPFPEKLWNNLMNMPLKQVCSQVKQCKKEEIIVLLIEILLLSQNYKGKS